MGKREVLSSIRQTLKRSKLKLETNNLYVKAPGEIAAFGGYWITRHHKQSNAVDCIANQLSYAVDCIANQLSYEQLVQWMKDQNIKGRWSFGKAGEEEIVITDYGKLLDWLDNNKVVTSKQRKVV